LAALTSRWLAAPPPQWAALVAADPQATPGQHPALARAFAAAMPGMTARFLAVEREGVLCGGMPAVVQRRAGFHWVYSMPALLAGAPLAVAGEREAVDLASGAALAALTAELGAVGGYRPGAPPPSDDALERVGGETRRFEASVIPLERGLEPLLQRMDRKTRKEMRLARDRGLALEQDAGALEAAYALYQAQARAWKAHRLVPLELLRRLLGAGESSEGLPPVARLFVIRDARGLLAATLALDSPRELQLWWSGTHPEARALHAFPLLLWSVVEWAHAAGRARVNLGASADRGAILAFKESLGADACGYPVRWFDARHAPPLGRAVARLQARVRRGRPRGSAA
jgi:hypothetical protein